MKQEIKPATGRLGVLVVGVGGAVATTMIVGTLASRKGLAKPIGSITQLATMRMENNGVYRPGKNARVTLLLLWP